MFEKKEKRGLSPVIATILLVALAVVLAVIIYFWARQFSEENITKGERDITLSCEEVSFNAEAIILDNIVTVYLGNTGRVPIYGLEIKKKGLGEILDVGKLDGEQIGEIYGVGVGESGEAVVGGGALVNGDILVLTPILLGETEEFRRAHVCDEDYAVEVTVAE